MKLFGNYGLNGGNSRHIDERSSSTLETCVPEMIYTHFASSKLNMKIGFVSIDPRYRRLCVSRHEGLLSTKNRIRSAFLLDQ